MSDSPRRGEMVRGIAAEEQFVYEIMWSCLVITLTNLAAAPVTVRTSAMSAYPIPCGCCIPPPKPSFTSGKGLPPLRTQGSPLRSDPLLRYRCEVDKPLTSFTPLIKEQSSGFLRKPSLSIFLLLLTSLSEAWSPRNSPFAFFAWLAHVP
jgi:hypothetical protein